MLMSITYIRWCYNVALFFKTKMFPGNFQKFKNCPNIIIIETTNHFQLSLQINHHLLGLDRLHVKEKGDRISRSFQPRNTVSLGVSIITVKVYNLLKTNHWYMIDCPVASNWSQMQTSTLGSCDHNLFQ